MTEEEREAAAMAEFCLATGIAPSEYAGLTDVERDALITEANRRARR